MTPAVFSPRADSADLTTRTLRLSTPDPRCGVSLLEVIIVIAIVGLLTGLLVAGVQRARAAAIRVACASNMRQLAIGVHLFSDARHQFPKGCDEGYSRAYIENRTLIGLSWQTAILPYLEQAALWSQVEIAHKNDPRGHSSEHSVVLATPVPVFVCPADGRRAVTNGLGTTIGLTGYRGIAGTDQRANDGIFHIDLLVRMTDVKDGLTQTLMIGERPGFVDGNYGGWYANWDGGVCPLSQILPAGHRGWIPSDGVGCPASIPSFAPGRIDSLCSIGHYWSLHPNGGNFAFADASVRYLPYSASELLPALATRADGDIAIIP